MGILERMKKRRRLKIYLRREIIKISCMKLEEC
jgi:hypothetical protein